MSWLDPLSLEKVDEIKKKIMEEQVNRGEKREKREGGRERGLTDNICQHLLFHIKNIGWKTFSSY